MAKTLNDLLTPQEKAFAQKLGNKTYGEMDEAERSFVDGIVLKAQAEREAPKAGDFAKEAVSALYTPVRGYRALGVMGSKVAAAFPPGRGPKPGTTAEEVAEAGARATKKGFEPKGTAEKVGSLVGENVPFMVAGGAASIPGKTLVKALARIAASSSEATAQEAFRQLSEEGKIDAGSLGFTAALGAGGQAAGEGIAAGARAVRSLGRKSVQKSTGLTKDQVSALSEDPSILSKSEGTEESVQKSYQDVQDAINELNDAAARSMSEAREAALIPKKKDVLFELAKAGERPSAKKLINNFEDAMKRPLYKEKPGLKAKYLMQLRAQIDEMLPSPKAGEVVSRPEGAESLEVLRARISDALDEIDYKPIQELRKAEKAGGEKLSLVEKLQPEFSTDRKALAVTKRLASGDPLSLPPSVTEDLIQLEKETGKELVEPLKRELMAFNLKRAARDTARTPGDVMTQLKVTGAPERLLDSQAMQEVVIPFLEKALAAGSGDVVRENAASLQKILETRKSSAESQ